MCMTGITVFTSLTLNLYFVAVLTMDNTNNNSLKLFPKGGILN